MTYTEKYKLNTELGSSPFKIPLFSLFRALFNLQNRPIKWNGYSYRIVNHLFGKGIFLGIVIPMGMTNPIHKGITIPLKNEWNNYSLWNGIDFPKKKKKTPYYFFLILI